MRCVLEDPIKLHNIVGLLAGLAKTITWHTVPPFVYLLARDSRARRGASTAIVQLVIDYFFELSSGSSAPFGPDAIPLFSVPAAEFREALEISPERINAFKIELRADVARLSILKKQHQSEPFPNDIAETEWMFVPLSLTDDLVPFTDSLVPRWDRKALIRKQAAEWRGYMERCSGRFIKTSGGLKTALTWDPSTIDSTTLSTEALPSRSVVKNEVLIRIGPDDRIGWTNNNGGPTVHKFPSRDVVRYLDRTVTTKYWPRVVVLLRRPSDPMIFGLGVGPELCALRLGRLQRESNASAEQIHMLLTEGDIRGVQIGTFHQRTNAFSVILLTPPTPGADNGTVADGPLTIAPQFTVGHYGGLSEIICEPNRETKTDNSSPLISVNRAPLTTPIHVDSSAPEPQPVSVFPSASPSPTVVPTTESIDLSLGLDEEEDEKPDVSQQSISSPQRRATPTRQLTSSQNQAPLSQHRLILSQHDLTQDYDPLDFAQHSDQWGPASTLPPSPLFSPTAKIASPASKESSATSSQEHRSSSVLRSGFSLQDALYQPLDAGSFAVVQSQTQLLTSQQRGWPGSDETASRTPWFNTSRTTAAQRDSWVAPLPVSGSQMAQPTSFPMATPTGVPRVEDSQNDKRRFSFMSEDFCDDGGDVDLDVDLEEPPAPDAPAIELAPPGTLSVICADLQRYSATEDEAEEEYTTEEARRREMRRLRDAEYRRALEPRVRKQMRL
eukprot:Protomagalhaensia_sp_Gyna_25__3478@NODE_312_length_3956_cov_2020_737554_g243_i0_p1_GENE_NODE_312_length_3956_cov_2020_737554_g243_i0NODE_312_length_3956_cov_2020_737554_g243_i0_p1_ORF_typecomplete_len726_score103_64_NODE_312_length_3956_cov_2020_737554_g243_i05772754